MVPSVQIHSTVLCQVAGPLQLTKYLSHLKMLGVHGRSCREPVDHPPHLTHPLPPPHLQLSEQSLLWSLSLQQDALSYMNIAGEEEEEEEKNAENTMSTMQMQQSYSPS